MTRYNPSDSGSFPSLGAQLAAALPHILSGTLRSMNHMTGQMAPEGKRMKGRHIPLEEYDHYRLWVFEVRILDFWDLVQVELHNHKPMVFRNV